MIGRRDQHNVEVLLLEHLAIVGISARLLLRDLPSGNHVGRVGEHLLIDVAQRNDLDGRDLDQAKQIGLSIPPAADEPDPRRLLIDKFSGKPARGSQRQSRGARMDKLTAIHGGAPGEIERVGEISLAIGAEGIETVVYRATRLRRRMPKGQRPVSYQHGATPHVAERHELRRAEGSIHTRVLIARPRGGDGLERAFGPCASFSQTRPQAEQQRP